MLAYYPHMSFSKPLCVHYVVPPYTCHYASIHCHLVIQIDPRESMKGKGRANETIRKTLSYGVSWQGIPAMRMCTFLCRHTHIHLKCTWGNFLCQLKKLLIVPETLGVVLGGTLSSPCTNGICLRNLMDLKRKLSPNCFSALFSFLYY